MPRPSFITQQDIARWDDNIQQDPDTQSYIALIPALQEVVYAGLYLAEQLRQLKCSPILISKIQYTAGQLSFNQDPWQVHQEMLSAYRNNELEFEIDYDAS